MANVRRLLEDIHLDIDKMKACGNVGDRYVCAKQLKEKIDILIASLISEENKLLSESLKKRHEK